MVITDCNWALTLHEHSFVPEDDDCRCLSRCGEQSPECPGPHESSQALPAALSTALTAAAWQGHPFGTMRLA